MGNKTKKTRLGAVIGALMLVLCASPALAALAENDRESKVEGTATLAAQPRDATSADALQARDTRRYKYDLETAGKGRGGHATAKGKLIFQGKRSVGLTGRVRDVCKNNGLGAYVYVLALDKKGKKIAFKQMGADNNGCGNGSAPISDVEDFRKPVAKARVVLREEDRTNGGQIVRFGPKDRGTLKGSPFVGG